MLEHLDMENTGNGHSEVDSEEDEEILKILEKFVKKSSRKKQKVGRISRWSTIVADDLVNIILENDKFKEKLLLTNVKNSKSSQ